jgi:hypothetical protein
LLFSAVHPRVCGKQTKSYPIAKQPFAILLKSYQSTKLWKAHETLRCRIARKPHYILLPSYVPQTSSNGL